MSYVFCIFRWLGSEEKKALLINQKPESEETTSTLNWWKIVQKHEFQLKHG
jgi:hypothetical protein